MHSAQIAIETYATEHAGSYSGATARRLRQIEPTIPPSLRVTEPGERSYTLSVKSGTGETFAVSFGAGPAPRFSCEPPGQDDCRGDGTWK